MTPLLLLACAASAATVETFPSYARVRAVAVDGEQVFVATEDGAYRLDLVSGRSESHPFPASAAPPAARLGDCEYRPDELGARRVCPRLAETVLPAGGFPVTAVAVHAGALYAATYGGGLRRVPSGARVPGVPDAATALAATADGLLIGTERGLYRVRGGGAAVPAGPAGPADGHITRLLRADGALWVAHFDRGVSRLENGVWRRWGRADGLPEWVDDLAWDGTRLWVAEEKGVFWIAGERVVRPADPRLARPTTALAAAGGAVRLAQAGRVLAWREGELAETAVPEEHPQRLLGDERGAWLAGMDGLWRVEGGTATRLGAHDGRVPDDWVTALALSSGALVAGTYDAGLVRVGAGPAEPELPRVWVNLGALDADGARLAVGEMERGVRVFDGAAWTRFGAAEGLPGEDASAVLFDGPDLWVGTRTGLARLRRSWAPMLPPRRSRQSSRDFFLSWARSAWTR